MTTPSPARLAAAWLRKIVANSRDPLFEKFLGERYEGGRAKVPNPNPRTRGRYREVAVSTALRDPVFEKKLRLEFERWKGSEKSESEPKTAPAKTAPAKPTPRWMARQDEILDLALKGEVVAEHPLGAEGETANKVSKRRLKLGDSERDFVWKPEAGEAASFRIGIPEGSYHRREQAVYDVDRLFGEGTVVPPTKSDGQGSYQEFQDGALSMFDVIEPVMSVEDLADNPDFHRINVLDLITGHEDRHPGNLMFVKDSSRPGGHRFIAIDNGTSLADPTDKVGLRAWEVKDPWTDIYQGEERVQARQALARSTQSIDRDLHDQIKEVDHDAFVRTLVRAGIKDRKALLASLVRLSAIQRDRKIVGSFAGEHHPHRFLGSQQEFQFFSAKEPRKLLSMAGDGPSLDELRSVVDRALA